MIQPPINRLRLLFLALLTSHFLYSQSELSGTVQDSSGMALNAATVILQSLSSNAENQFAITDDKGSFKFGLPHREFRIKVSHIGFASFSGLLEGFSGDHMVVKLSPQVEDLEEIVLNYKPSPIQVKVDTLTFSATEFSDGQEYKLKNLIQKLPGVEYEKGVLTINGKRITEVLVEGDRFFNGSTVLAVENIPANAVKDLEFIDDHSDSPLLKNLENSEKTVMNIKLKEGKKNFFFGDLGLSYGNRDYYKIEPTLFKYSKKHKYAVIGAANNMGAPLDNILALQESLSGVETHSSGVWEELKFENKEVQDISEKAIGAAYDGLLKADRRLAVNVVAHGAGRSFLTRSFTRYFNDASLYEERELNRDQKFENYFARLGYEDELKDQGLFKVHTEFSKESSVAIRSLQSGYGTENINVESQDRQESSSINSEVYYLKKINSRTTLNSRLFSLFKRDQKHLQLLGNDDFLEQYITRDQQTGLFSQAFRAVLGDLNFSNDLFYSFNLGHSLKLSGNLHTLVYKRSFDNDSRILKSLPSALSDSYNYFSDMEVGSMYNFNNEAFFIEAGMSFLHRKLPNTTENHILPKLSLEFKPSFGNEIQLKYELLIKRPDHLTFFEGGLLRNFDHIEFGNTQLSSGKYQSILFSSLITDLRKGLTLRADMSLQRTENSVIQTTSFSGINRITGYSNWSTPTNDLNSRVVAGKIFSSFKINGSLGYRNFERGRGLNGAVNIQKLEISRARLHVETLLEKEFPNLFFRYTASGTQLTSGDFKSKYSSNTYNFGLRNNSGKFTYDAEYEYMNNSSRFEDSFSNLKFAMAYNFENSPWLLSLLGDNLLNTRHRDSQAIQEAFISEVQTARLPAMLLFGVTYKI